MRWLALPTGPSTSLLAAAVDEPLQMNVSRCEVGVGPCNEALPVYQQFDLATLHEASNPMKCACSLQIR